MYGRRRNHSLDGGDRGGSDEGNCSLDEQTMRNPSPGCESKRGEERNQSVDQETRRMDQLLYKNNLEPHQNQEPLKTEESVIWRKKDGQDSGRRIERKQYGGESRRKLGPDEELRKLEGRSGMADGEIFFKAREADYGEEGGRRVVGEEEQEGCSSEWELGDQDEGELDGPSEV